MNHLYQFSIYISEHWPRRIKNEGIGPHGENTHHEQSAHPGNSSAYPVEDRSGRCILCPTLFRVGRKEDNMARQELPRDSNLYYELFHKPCSTCQLVTTDRGDPICSTCEHLRLPHLLERLHSTSGQYIDSFFPLAPSISSVVVQLNRTVSVLHGASNCSLCRSIAIILARRGNYDQRIRKSLDGGHVAIQIKPSGGFITISLGLLNQNRFCDVRGMDVWTGREFQSRFVSHEHALRQGINWTLVEDFLRPQETSLSHIPRGFMLIDVRAGCLVDPPRRFSYASLSYVWGDVPPGSTTTGDTVLSFRRKGRLFESDTPATILDAMQVCRRLRRRFLWVDRYCIIQDSDTKYDQIQCMGDIYAGSDFTIVGCAGNDASYGLPGVSRPRHCPPQQRLVLSNTFHLTEILPEFSEDILPTSTWPTRGWTFQEAALSRILVVFTDDGVYLEDHAADRSCSEGRPDSHAVFDFGDCYTDAVQSYTSRILRYETDITPAFSGFLNVHYRYASVRAEYGGYSTVKGHRFCLPLDDINTAVLWQVSGKVRMRNSPGKRYPTWSWTSVVGEINYDGLTEDDYARQWFYGPIATWQVFGNDELQYIGFSSSLPNNGLYNGMGKWRSWEWLTLLIAWREGCFPRNLPLHCFAKEDTWSAMGASFLARWPTYKSFYFDSRVAFRLSEEQEKETKRRDSLIVHSQVSIYWLEHYEVARKADCCELFRLRDKTGQCAGLIWLDQIQARIVLQILDEEKSFSAELIAIALRGGELVRDIEDVERCPTTGSWEYVLKKSRQGKSERMEAFLDEMDYFDAEGKKRPSWLQTGPPVLALMMLSDHGVVRHRIGIGHVFLKQWAQSGPEFQTVVLG